MEANTDKIKLISKKEQEKNKRNKEIIRFLILIFLTNSLTAFLFSTNYESSPIENSSFIPYEGFEEINLKAESFVSTEGSTIKIIGNKNQVLCENAIYQKEQSSIDSFSNIEGHKEYLVFIPPICFSKLLTAKNIKFVPQSFHAQPKETYEIIY